MEAVRGLVWIFSGIAQFYIVQNKHKAFIFTFVAPSFLTRFVFEPAYIICSSGLVPKFETLTHLS